MDRLTFEGNFCDISRCQNTPGGSFCEDGACSQRKVWERLKEYEDTERRPEEVQALNRLFDYALTESRTLQEQLALIERLRELAEADKDGRLVVLPYCKLGDTVYWLHDKKITECRVYRIQENTKGVQIAIKSTVSHGVFSVDDYFGKTIFFTREEAEKALEGRK